MLLVIYLPPPGNPSVPALSLPTHSRPCLPRYHNMASKPIELNVHAGEIARDEDKKVATTANHESIYLVPYAKPVQMYVLGDPH